MESIAGGFSQDATRALVEEVRKAVRAELREAGIAPSGQIEIAARWDGGELVLRPSREGLQEKVVPLETFFRKIVSARERLRVLEQKINNHPKLDDAERLELQDYITKIYGSFTTFNILFEDRSDGFAGSGGR